MLHAVRRRTDVAGRSGSCEAEVFAGCVERDSELARIAAYLGEEEAALDAGHGGRGELGGVCVGSELTAGFHAGEAVAEVGFPAVEAGGDRGPRLRVLLGELTGKGADWAAAACLTFGLEFDERIEPALDPRP